MTSLSKIVSEYFNVISPSQVYSTKKYEWVVSKLGAEKCKQILKDNLQNGSINLLYEKYKEDKYLNNYPTNIKNSNTMEVK